MIISSLHIYPYTHTHSRAQKTRRRTPRKSARCLRRTTASRMRSTVSVSPHTMHALCFLCLLCRGGCLVWRGTSSKPTPTGAEQRSCAHERGGSLGLKTPPITPCSSRPCVSEAYHPSLYKYTISLSISLKLTHIHFSSEPGQAAYGPRYHRPARAGGEFAGGEGADAHPHAECDQRGEAARLRVMSCVVIHIDAQAYILSISCTYIHIHI